MNRLATVLVTGQGAREHALAAALARSPRVGRVIVSPGHDALHAGHDANGAAPVIAMACGAATPEALLALARRELADLCVIGPEAHLDAGLADLFEAAGIAVFGPTRAAARIETSKAETRVLLGKLQIPTPNGAVVTTMSAARAVLASMSPRVVVKASGLAAGKGTFICNDHDAALGRIWRLLEARELGEAGETVIIEDFETGAEASVMAICDRNDCVVLPAVRDYKKAGNGDTGPNTGGLGAVAPLDDFDGVTLARLRNEVFVPVLRALAEGGRPYRGVLYAGLMRTDRGLVVLEFNARFGDPETQVLLELLASDLFAVIEAASRDGLREHLEQHPLRWHAGAAAAVVLAANGYPGVCETGRYVPAELLAAPKPLSAYGAGLVGDVIHGFRNGGGRTLTLVGRGVDIGAARAVVYRHLAAFPAPGFFFRRDIGADIDKVSAYRSEPAITAETRPDKVSATAMTYSDAGVAIARAETALNAARPAIEATWSAAVRSRAGAYAALFDTAAFADIGDPVLVVTQDGLGTKTLLAQTLTDWEGLGRDLVHHAVNDLLAAVARPLFMVDQISAARLEPPVVTALLCGMAGACKAHGIALVGGETAEMPDVFTENGVDVAATLVGVTSRRTASDTAPVRVGDLVYGLPSFGLHTNGYTLARRVFGVDDLESALEPDGPTVRALLLAPHRSYAVPIATLRDAGVHPSGLVHITGGAFRDNPPRIIAPDCSLFLQPWRWPPLFSAIARRGRIPTDEMRAVFNLGHGLLVILAPNDAVTACRVLPELVPLGRIVARADPEHPERLRPPVFWSGDLC